MGVTYAEPRKPRKFTIIEDDLKGADRKNPCQCLIARAFLRQFPEGLLEVQVFATKTTLLWSGGRCERYETPKVLGNALREFDRNGEWVLPPGTYALPPLRLSKTRKAVRERAIERRLKGDEYMNRAMYPQRKKHTVPTRDRVLNLMAFRRLNKKK